MKRGFTLVEIIVVLGVFAILVLAGTDFVIQMIRSNNQTIIQNEVRQNANSVMQLLTNSIRNASCVSWSGGPNETKTLVTYSDIGCSSGQEQDTYTFYITTGRVSKIIKAGTASEIISGTVAACGDNGCGPTCSTNGLVINDGDSSNSGKSLPVKISLTLQQTPRTGLRADFCGRITLTETVTPRQY